MNIKTQKYTIDFKDVKGIYDMFEIISTAMNFPDYFGNNWDAFWDLLWSECDADKVIIKGAASLHDDLKKEMPIMHEILERNSAFRKENNLNEFSFEVI